MGSVERSTTVFSQEGRLWQVEYAFKAVKQAEITAIGCKNKHCVAVAVQKKVPDRLIDPDTVTHMFRVTENVGACIIGIPFDVRYLSFQCKSEANEFKSKNGFDPPASHIAQTLSLLYQEFTQHIPVRNFAATTIVFGYDDSTEEFSLYKVDPSGFCCAYRALSAGVKETDGTSYLEKKMGDFEDSEKTVEFVLRSLQEVCNTDFEPSGVEVVLLTKSDPAFKLLPEGRVKQILDTVAEKD